MTFPISLQQDEYESLVELARQGTLNDDGSVQQEKALALNTWLVSIETNNGITRYAVWVQWQEAGAPLPAGTNFPEVWPPQLRQYLALTSRPIAKADVLNMLASKAREPVSVLVTKDPAATAGWTELDVFFK